MNPHHLPLYCNHCEDYMPHEIFASWADGICVKCGNINPLNERTWPLMQRCCKVEQEKRV